MIFPSTRAPRCRSARTTTAASFFALLQNLKEIGVSTSEFERDWGMRLNLDKVTTKEKHELQSRREQQLDKSHDSKAAPSHIPTRTPGWGAYAKKTENKNVSQSIHNPSSHDAIELHPSEAGHFTVCMLVYVCVCHGVCVFSAVHKCMSQV